MSDSRPRDLTAYRGCIANADELLRGARGLLERDGLPRLAYHIAVLALEEIGKARMIAMQSAAERCGRETSLSIKANLDNHVRKLFWAIWGPSMGHELITREQIDENMGLAARLHEKRLAGLYVDRSQDGDVSLPMERIPSEEAAELLRFVTACIELARAADDVPDEQPEATERQIWFFDVTDDPERRNIVLGPTSMEKLKELGSVVVWVEWLKEIFAKADAEAKASLERELRREPDSREDAKPKWRTTIRLYSTTHSIRQKHLNEANEGLLWTKLRHVSGKPDQLLVDLLTRSDMKLEDLWKHNLILARRLVMALNVGSFGYFWFHEQLDRDSKQSGRFYESLVDLMTGKELKAHRTPSLRFEFAPRRVLGPAEINRWVLCFGSLLRCRDDEEIQMVERYLDGLTMIAKSDAHMAFEIQSVAAFYMALRHAMKAYGYWGDEPFQNAVYRFASELLPGTDDRQITRLTDVGEAVNTGRPVTHAMQMNDVGVVKALCDVYLLQAFRRRERR